LEVGEQAFGAMAQEMLLDLDKSEGDQQEGEGGKTHCAKDANNPHANLYTASTNWAQ